jgi:hypothetical protein
VFTVNPQQATFTRDDLLRVLRGRGSDDFEPCDSMRPLHTYPVFAAPRSPVTTYQAPLIRSDLRTSEELAATAIRVAVPAEDDPAGLAHSDTAVTALSDALRMAGSATLGG